MQQSVCFRQPLCFQDFCYLCNLMRYKIVLSYNGSAFSGWQVQNNAPSVQGVLQDALSMLLRQEITVVGAGRTDAGVNARNYVAHFDAGADVDCGRLCFKLNAVLPREIAVHSIDPAADDFHARFSAVRRQYKYYIHNQKDPFNDSFSWYCRYPLDVERMNRACGYLLGVHDCSCFEKKGSDNATSICEIFAAHWKTVPSEAGFTGDSASLRPLPSELGPLPLPLSGGGQAPVNPAVAGNLVFTVEANRFLRNMVRAIVGTMVDIGRGVHEPEYILEILDHGTRGDAGQSVPGHALFLTRIDY